MPDYSAEIAALEEILNAGTSSVSTDGLSMAYDLEQVRKRLTELKALDDATVTSGRPRPRTVTIRLPFN
jgi:hypothetical protein